MTTPTFGDGHARLNVDDDNDDVDNDDDDDEMRRKTMALNGSLACGNAN